MLAEGGRGFVVTSPKQINHRKDEDHNERDGGHQDDKAEPGFVGAYFLEFHAN